MRHLQSGYQEILGPALKAGIFVDIVPPGPADNLSTKLEDDGTYEDRKEFVLRCLETRTDQGLLPLDVDRFEVPESPENREITNTNNGLM